ncbi:hypothetical protein X943_003954 [Babesia divergens]|uniref:Vacuolar protein sorting-associated protein 51 homolog n=1 Tax=Babesia divergens TaxID=32595 RepID=A0AAD9GE93_BABDI|nr:hypothetical protein X943_003954 [Babesia divergens]
MSGDTESSDTDFAEADAERSVADLLSAFHDADDDENGTSTGKTNTSNCGTPHSEEDAILTGAIFTQEDFDLDSCLNTALTKYSMVDLIALLRRLEREVRQFTAGKQLLIYDNYECLFTALDTVHEINGELTVIQKHLQALKTSQIKASSIDISSRYGIREKLLKISEINRVLNIFQALTSIATCLSDAKQKAAKTDMDKRCVTHLLETIAKVHVILNVVSERAEPKANKIKLFHTFNKYIKEIIPDIIKGMNRLFKNERLSHDELVNICSNLAKSHMTDKQVWGYYWLNKSLLLRHRLERIVKDVKSSTVTLYALSNSITDFLLSVVEAVHSDGYLNLTKCVEASSKQGCRDINMDEAACIFCCDSINGVAFTDSENNKNAGTREDPTGDTASPTYSHYWVQAPPGHKCTCITDEMAQQFASCYVQLAFAALQHRIMNRAKTITTNELIFVLTGILDKLKNIRKEDLIVRYIMDIACRGMLSIVLLHLQNLFYPIYEAGADVILLFSENSNIFKGVADMVDHLLKDEVIDLLNFVDDLGTAMQLSLRSILSSFVMLYIAYLKHIFNLLFKWLVTAYDSKHEKNDYLASVSSLLALRGSSGSTRQRLMAEHLEVTKERNRKALNDAIASTSGVNWELMGSELERMKTALSVDHFVECMLREKVDKWSSTESVMRSTLAHIIESIYRFNRIFDDITKETAEKLGRPSTLVTGTDLKVMIPPSTNLPTQTCVPIARSIYLADIIKYEPTGCYIDGLFGDQLVHPFHMIYAIHKFDKEGSLTGLIPLIKTPEGDDDKGGEAKRKSGLVEVNSLQLAQNIISYVMCGYVTTANAIIRCAMENVESGESMADLSIKDFTGMMYDMIEFLNATADAALGDEPTQAKITEMHRKLNDIIGRHDIHGLNSIYEFQFIPSKEFCLKLFTIRIAQCISRAAKEHAMKVEHLTGIISRIEMQLLVAFRKSSDIDQMKRTFGQLAYPDNM